MVDVSGRIRLRAAVIGAGFIGPHHVDAVRRTGLADVVAIADLDGDRAAAQAANLGVGLCLSVAEALHDPDIDVVHICTPNDSHVDLAVAALKAGKHIVLEKPIAFTRADAAEVVRVGEDSGLHAAVAFTYRGYDLVRCARAVAQGPEFGAIRLVQGQYLQDWLLEPTAYDWRVDPRRGGPSRAVADIGSHWFNMAEYVTGRRVEAVCADLATFIPVRNVGTGDPKDGIRRDVSVSTEDAATILLRFEGGARGLCIVSQVSPGFKNDLVIEVTGESKSLGWRQEMPNQLAIRSSEEGVLLVPRSKQPDREGSPSLPAGHPEGWPDALSNLLRSFYQAVANGSPAEGDQDYPTLSEGARAVAFVDAALRSSRSGTWELL